jgi:hypothetical protein
VFLDIVHRPVFLCFLIGIVRGRVQLGPLGTAATNWPTVRAQGDYDDGEIGGMIGRGNRSTRRKPAPVPLCPPQIPHACPDANPGRRGGKPETNRMSYGTARFSELKRFMRYATSRKVAGSIPDEVIGFFFSIYLTILAAL